MTLRRMRKVQEVGLPKGVVTGGARQLQSPGLPEGVVALIFAPMVTEAPEPSFRRNLLRVMTVQVLTLLVLWLLQARYGR